MVRDDANRDDGSPDEISPDEISREEIRMTRNRVTDRRRVRIGNRCRAFLLTLAVWNVLALVRAAAPEPVISQEAAETAADKIAQIQRETLAGSAIPLIFTEEEANSYLSIIVAPDYPSGLSEIRLNFLDARLRGTADMDFDEVKRASEKPLPPMMEVMLFGEHTLTVEGPFRSLNGRGEFRMEAVSLDGIPLPLFMVDFMLDHFIRPRFPGFDPNRLFALPFSMDRIEILPAHLRLFGQSPNPVEAFHLD